MKERYVLNVDNKNRPLNISIIDPTEETKRIWAIFKEMNERKKKVRWLSSSIDPETLLMKAQFEKDERIEELEKEIQMIKEAL